MLYFITMVLQLLNGLFLFYIGIYRDIIEYEDYVVIKETIGF